MALVLRVTLFLTFFFSVHSHGLLQILMLGGNGFLGSHVSLALLGHRSRMVNITIVSRGNWPYDTFDTIQPLTFHVACDRYHENGLRGCPEFMKLSQEMVFDYVVDFSAYGPNEIQESLMILKQRAGAYIYISTDSVYEVSQRPDTPRKSIEEDAVRPEDPEQRQALKEADSYGDQKLAGEEIIQTQQYVPYVILRLPDIMGERDSTNRWWFYVLWLQYYKEIGVPLQIPEKLSALSTSFVYAPDVARLIADIIFGRYPDEINKQAYNLGFEEGRTLKQLLTEMSEILKADVNFETSENAIYMFPSVTRGEVDVSKAKKILNFKITDWNEALKTTVLFYKNAGKKFIKEQEIAVKRLLKLVVPEENTTPFLEAIEQEYKDGGRLSHLEL